MKKKKKFSFSAAVNVVEDTVDCSHMSAEESGQQAAFGHLWGLGPVQVRRPSPTRTKNIQLLETVHVDDLEERGRQMWRTGEGLWTGEEVTRLAGSGLTSFCQLMETLPVLNME